MATPDFEVAPLDNLRQSIKRAVALLKCSHDTDVDAFNVYGSLTGDRLREVRNRFDMWIDDVQHNNRYFHGFDKDGYRDCFVFKWKAKNKGQRLYGFLCNPRPKTNRAFRLCVLTNHAEKPHPQKETDPHELDKANELRVNPYVKAAILMTYPDEAAGEKKWPN